MEPGEVVDFWNFVTKIIRLIWGERGSGEYDVIFSYIYTNTTKFYFIIILFSTFRLILNAYN